MSIQQQLARMDRSEATVKPQIPGVASLLFDTKEAAKLDIAAIHSIGINGLLELSQVDPRFSSFEDTLFSEKSQGFERTLHTGEESSNLGTRIEQFLMLLSPHFMIRAAHKCLEYLIRNYRSNEYDVDALLACSLPFHETVTFARLLQLLKLSGKWVFLAAAAKAGVPVSRSIFVNQFFSDSSVLKFVCIATHNAYRAATLSKAAISFFCVLCMDVIRLKPVTEPTLNALMPPILKALAGKDAEYVTAAYLILSQLASSTPLALPTLSAFYAAVLRSMSDKTFNNGVLLLIHLGQTQKLALLPDMFLGSFIETQGEQLITAMHSYIAEEYDMDNIIKLIIATLLNGLKSNHMSSPTIWSLFRSILRDLRISRLAAWFTSSLLSLMSNAADGQEEISQESAAIMRLLAHQYPQELDEGLAACLKEAKDANVSKTLMQFAHNTFAGTIHQTVKAADSEVTMLCLAIRHPDVNIRLAALTQLDSLPVDDAEISEFSSTSLKSCLLDDDERVIRKIFSLSVTVSVLDAKFLIDTVESVLHSDKDSQTKCSAVLFLVRKILPKHPKALARVACVICSVLLPTPRYYQSTLQCLKILGELKYPLFTKLSTVKQTKLSSSPPVINAETFTKDFMEELVALSGNILLKISESVAEHIEELLPLVKKFSNTSRSACIFGTLVLLNVMKLVPESALRLAQDILPFVSEEMKLSTGKLVKSIDADFSQIDILLDHLIRSQMTLGTPAEGLAIGFPILQFVCSNTYDTRVDIAALDSTPAEASTPLVKLLDVSYRIAIQYWPLPESQTLVKIIMKHFLKDGAALLKFLARFWLEDGGSAVMKVRSLNIAATFMASNQKAPPCVFMEVFPAILVALCANEKSVRAAAINCMKAIHYFCHKIPDNAEPPAFFSGSETPKLSGTIYVKLIASISAMYEELVAGLSFLRGLLACRLSASRTSISQAEAQHVDAYICNYALLLGSRKFTLAQLTLFEVISDTPSVQKFSLILPLFENILLSLGESSTITECRTMAILMRQIGSETANFLVNSPRAFNILTNSLSSDFVAAFNPTTEEKIVLSQDSPCITFSPRESALQVISPVLWKVLSLPMQKKLFDIFFRIQLGQHVQAKALTRDILKAVDLPAKMLVEYLDSVNTNQTEHATPPNKKIKPTIPTQPPTSEQISEALAKAGVVLEVVTEKEGNWHLGFSLLPSIFGLLKCLIDESHPAASVPSADFILQLVISAIGSVTKSLTDDKDALMPKAEQHTPVSTDLPPTVVKKKKADTSNEQRLQQLRSAYDVEAIVQVLKTAHTPQIQNNALLLLAAVASLEPKLVLAHMISILSVVGSSTLLRDDGSTSHALLKTIECLVPPMASSDVGPAPLVQVVVNGFKSVPPHRRLPLFTTLVSSLQLHNMASVLVSLLGSYVIDPTAGAADYVHNPRYISTSEGLPVFMHSLCLQFSPQTVSVALVNLVQFAITITKRPSSPLFTEYCNISSLPTEQVNILQLAVVTFVGEHLAHKEFVEHIVLLSDDAQQELQASFLKLFEVLIQLSEHASLAKQPSTHFTRLLDCVQESLSALNELLSIKGFIETVSKLLQHHAHHVRHTALVLLNEKLVEVEGSLTADEAKLFVDTSGLLGVVASMVTSKPARDSKEHAITRQTALMILEILARNFAKEHTNIFGTLLSDVIQAINDQDDNVVSSAIICLATFVAELGTESLSHLPAYMPLLLQRLESTFTETENKDVHDLPIMKQLSCLSALEVIVKHVGSFLSPYVMEILEHSLNSQLLSGAPPQVVDSASRLRQLCADTMEYRTLLPAIFTLYSSQIKDCSSVCALFSFLGSILSRSSPSEASQHRKQLLKFFIGTFDCTQLLKYAASGSTDPDTYADDDILKNLDDIEDSIISAFANLILKLNETAFKPIFLKIVALLDSAVSQTDEQQTLLFLKVVNTLADKLKSIFVPYFGYLIDNLMLLLKRRPSNELIQKEPADSATPASKKRKRSEMESSAVLQRTRRMEAKTVTLVLDVLHKCFLYDTQRFVDSQKLDKLLAICDVIENDAIGQDEYLPLVNEHLVPCIGQFGVALGSDKLWKPLNYQLLLRTHHSNSDVRLASLRCVLELWKRLGVDMVVLLPETLPSLAEVMEDANPDVEHAAQELAGMMQSHLGSESLKDYL